MSTCEQKTAFISYGDNKYQNSKKRIYNQANDSKFFNTIKIYGPEDLNIDFRNKFINILNRPRGGGYWIWKHQVILQELEKLNYNDILVYCDAGCTVNKLGRETFNNYINLLNQSNKCIVSFKLKISCEKNYTIKEIYDYFNYPIDDSKQIVGGILIMKKTNNLLDMFKLYQKCLHDNPLLITDDYNNKQEDYFIDNRHDQSIFSIIRKKYKDYCIFIDDNTFYKNFNCEEAKKIPFLATRISI